MPVFDFAYWTDTTAETLTGDGPIIPVEVSIPTALEQFYLEKKMLLPSVQRGHALIDTGASTTAVDERVLQQLNILPIDETDCSSPHGTAKNSIYPLKVSFPALNLKDLPLARVLGCELKWQTADGKEIIMLLGRDLLQDKVLIYNGKGWSITLAF
jgi:hypothetical protein